MTGTGTMVVPVREAGKETFDSGHNFEGRTQVFSFELSEGWKNSRKILGFRGEDQTFRFEDVKSEMCIRYPSGGVK